MEERGGPSFVPGTSAAALVTFPTIPNLEQELQGFASGFANLPSSGGEHYGPGGVPGKRPIAITGDDDYRNVRSREDSGNTPLPLSTTASSSASASLSQHSHHQSQSQSQSQSHPHHHAHHRRPSLTAPGAAGTMVRGAGSSFHQPPVASASTASSVSGPAGPQNSPAVSTASTGSGFDWLVVYNPKAVRTLTIDLLHTMLHENVVCCVRFSPDGRFLATGSNRIASVYDVRSGERVGTFVDVEGVDKDTDQFVRSVSFSPDNSLLVTGSEDQVVRVWDVASQRLKCKLAGHSQDIYSVEFMPNGQEVVSGSGDRTVRIWDIEKARCRLVLNVTSGLAGGSTETTTTAEGSAASKKPIDAGITSIALSPNGRFLAAGALDRSIRLWETDMGRACETLEGHRDSVYSVAFAPDGRHLISGSLDKTIKVWQFDSSEDLSRGTCKYTILGHKDFVLSVAGTPPDGRWIISGSKDRSVQFWDSQSGTTQLMLQGHKNSVISVAVCPTGMIFATGSGDCRARIWSYTYTTGAANTNGNGTVASVSSAITTTEGGAPNSGASTGAVGSSSSTSSASLKSSKSRTSD